MSDEPVQTFASVWDALEPTQEDATQMRLRSDLAIAIRAAVESWGSPEAETARKLGLDQSRLGDLLGGRLTGFSLDDLVGLAERAGLAVRMEIGRDAA